MRWGVCSWSLRHGCVPVFTVRRRVQDRSLWYPGGDDTTVFWLVRGRQMGWPWGDKRNLPRSLPLGKVEPRWLRRMHFDLAHSEAYSESHSEADPEAHSEAYSEAHSEAHGCSHTESNSESHQSAHAET